MKSKTTVGLLISTYNWPEALNLVLMSILDQTVMPDEILIADDGSGKATKDLIDSYRKKFTIPIKHHWQEDNGFRKTIIINKAIADTACDYIIQIDGDILMSTHFIEDHVRVSEPGYYIRGSRVLMQLKKSLHIIKSGSLKRPNPLSKGIINRVNAFRVPVISSFFIKRSMRTDNLHGSNCAYWREDFIKVNGYNNEMHGWGYEDIELAARFVNIGLKQKKVKMLSICYHLYHKFSGRERESINWDLYLEAVKGKLVTCANGYKEANEMDY